MWTTSLRPYSATVRCSIRLGEYTMWPLDRLLLPVLLLSAELIGVGMMLLEPLVLVVVLVGTLSVVCAVLVVLLLPAASVSHTASVQVPGPGTVTVAGPFAEAAIGGSHDPGLLVEQTW
jgi:hypothetical protein